MVTVFKAQKILTMDHNLPVATHVAVRDSVIVGVGGADCGDGWGQVSHDDRFADHVITPGLIEAHAHVSAGGIWRYTYCGHYLRTDPAGNDWTGVDSTDAIIQRLREVAAKTPEWDPVVGWGYDPGFVSGERLGRLHLDYVSTAHPVSLTHSNGHVMAANSVALERAGLNTDTNIEGVVRSPDGTLSGELHEFAAMQPVMEVVGFGLAKLSDSDGVAAYGQVARNCGVTTVADLFSDLHEDEVSMLLRP